jgi:hypothetical protein
LLVVVAAHHKQGICVLWDDHDPTRCGRVYYTIKGTVAGTRKLIVTWYQVCHFGGGANDAVTFQVQLDEATGKISMFYPYIQPHSCFYLRAVSKT